MPSPTPIASLNSYVIVAQAGAVVGVLRHKNADLRPQAVSDNLTDVLDEWTFAWAKQKTLGEYTFETVEDSVISINVLGIDECEYVDLYLRKGLVLNSSAPVFHVITNAMCKGHGHQINGEQGQAWRSGVTFEGGKLTRNQAAPSFVTTYMTANQLT